jgi:hypothetical protein
MADAGDLKSPFRKGVRVRVPPPGLTWFLQFAAETASSFSTDGKAMPCREAGRAALDRHPVEGRRTPAYGAILGNYAGCIVARKRITGTRMDSQARSGEYRVRAVVHVATRVANP